MKSNIYIYIEWYINGCQWVENWCKWVEHQDPFPSTYIPLPKDLCRNQQYDLVRCRGGPKMGAYVLELSEYGGAHKFVTTFGGSIMRIQWEAYFESRTHLNDMFHLFLGNMTNMLIDLFSHMSAYHCLAHISPG